MEPLTFFVLAAYAASTLAFLLHHHGAPGSAAMLGRRLLGAGFALQMADIGLRCTRLQHPAASTSEAMAFIAWLIAGGFLVASLRYRLAAVGAFAGTPALALLLLARVRPAEAPGPEIGLLGMAHIVLATVGVATFALAAAVALAYLWQERALKRKQLDRSPGGTTPLDALDRFATRCVSFGFLTFSLAIITGALWVARLGLLHDPSGLRPEYLGALGSWLVFAALLVARAGAGWRGHRAAWLTVGGFASTMLVVVGYFLRHAA